MDRWSVGDLPVELTSFVGRRREMAEVRRLLEQSRLVTLTGVGGSGKTRVAVRVAAGLRRAFPGGVRFVDLSAVGEAQLVAADAQDSDRLASLVRTGLGLREQPGAGLPTHQLVRYLAERRCLLVLDNCEHLVPVCALLVGTLLQGCPQLRVLATSREPLLLAGEAVFEVPPLPSPEPPEPASGSVGGAVAATEVGRYEAVALFIARAQAVAPDFVVTGDNAQAVAELCRRLDGLPLALELAAARVRVLTPEQILDRLAGRFAVLSRGSHLAPARQQTLRGCVEWSFELCSKPERVLWTRLAVFAGGFELDAVEGICADDVLPAEGLLEVVAGLVDKSVLIRDDAHGAVGPTARYRMLETLRDYGHDRLVESGDREHLRRRHRDWYADLARRFQAAMISPQQREWLARLDRELPNLRTALEHSLADPDGTDPDETDPDGADPDGVEAALTILTCSYFYWTLSGRHREARSWLDRALARPTGPSMLRQKTLYCGAAMASLQGDLPAARTRVRAANENAAQLGQVCAQAFADTARGVTEMGGELDVAVQAWQRGVAGFAAEPGEEYLLWRVSALGALAMSRAMHGDTAGAVAAAEAVLAICRPRGEAAFAGLALWVLGIGRWKQGDLNEATARLQEGLQLAERTNHLLGAAAWSLDTLAWVAYDQGQPQRAATLLGVSAHLAATLGARPSLYPELAAVHEQYQQRTRTALGEQAFQDALAAGQRLSFDQAVAYALHQDPRPPAPPFRPDPPIPLSRREQQVAELVTQGLSNKQIAVKLVISQRTAEGHVRNILTKLGLTNRAHIAAWWRSTR